MKRLLGMYWFWRIVFNCVLFVVLGGTMTFVMIVYLVVYLIPTIPYSFVVYMLRNRGDIEVDYNLFGLLYFWGN